MVRLEMQAHYGPHLRTKLTRMREVESEDGSLAVLGLGVSKLTLGKSSSIYNLRAMRG